MSKKPTTYEKAIKDIEQVSKAGFYFTPRGKLNEHYFAKDLRYLGELNARYEFLFKLFVDMGFCNFCPAYPSHRANCKCSVMLEKMLDGYCKERV